MALHTFPFILFNRSLYHSAFSPGSGKRLLKVDKAQNNFFFLLLKFREMEII